MNNYLFSTQDLQVVLQVKMDQMADEVASIEANRLLNTAVADLVAYLAQKYVVEPVRLERAAMTAEMQEAPVDVSQDQQRWISDRSRPYLIPGEATDIHVPFTGETVLLRCRSNTFSMSPPRADIEANELVLRYRFPSEPPVDVKPLMEATLAAVDEYLRWQQPLIDAHNHGLTRAAADAVEQRRARLLGQARRAAALGIPVRRRGDQPQTFAISTVRRKAPPTLPPAASTPYDPEPTWALEHYEFAINVIYEAAVTMERSPTTYQSMGEEDIRQLILFALNSHFEGGATGETFNKAGKTDILLREASRNVFIAECKIWKGPQSYQKAIDQLLGYLTWRDAKTAILVFNRGTDSSTVLTGIETVTKAHASFKRAVTWPNESGFRYILGSPSDANREITLSVIVFHVPV